LIVIPLLIATCANLIALGVMLPALPFFVTEYGAGLEVAAMIFSVFSAASLVTAPLWGRLSDRIGRKPVMLISVACTCLSYIWLANADALWELYASRAFAGAAAGWLTASQAYIADVTTPKNRARGLGFLGATFGVAFTIGPAITVLAPVSLSQLALISAGFTAVGFVLALVLIKEPVRHEAPAPSRFDLGLFRTPVLARLFAIYFFVYLSFTGLEGTFALWTQSLFGYGQQEVGLYFVYIGLLVIVFQGGLVGPFVKRFGEPRTVLIGILTLGLGLATLPAATTPLLVLLPLGLVVFGFSIFGPAVQSLMTQHAGEDRKGAIMGVAQSFASAARIAGPAGAGYVFAGLGVHWPYIIIGLLLAPVALAVLPLIRKKTIRAAP
jgi:DHA1 family tetracycline resistance protein-like MFS transporter